MNLDELGWNNFFAKHFEQYATSYRPGRVAVEHKSIYRLYTERGELTAEISGKLRHQATGHKDLPAVGDWVAISVRENEERATIHHLLPRQSKFSRKAAGELEYDRIEEQIVAANVDTVFIVVGLDDNFNLRRIERYLITAWESGANPIVVLNKADLCQELELRMVETEGIALGVPVIALSAAEGEGLEALMPYLEVGKTVALLGSSGVGKSTIINGLMGDKVQQVGELSEKVGKGKHTTTHRELILLPSGGLIMDTPGMRELQLWSADEGFESTFEDIEELTQRCRFRDCQHHGDPGCAIDRAIADGTLDIGRFRNYQKMQRELAYVARKQDQQAMLAEKAKWKQLTKSVKHLDKRR